MESEEEWEGMTEEEHLQLVEQEGMLAAVSVTLQWLFENEELIKMCGRTAHNLWTSLAKLFNLIRLDYEKLNIAGEFWGLCSMPLSPERASLICGFSPALFLGGFKVPLGSPAMITF